jgi:cytochrome P450
MELRAMPADPAASSQRKPARPPMAPGGLPLIGHLLPLARHRLAFMESLRAHGDIVRIRLGPSDAYVVNSPELLHQVLVSQAGRFDHGRIFVKARAYLGNGLGTSEGEFHLRQRRMMAPAFHVTRLRGYAEVMRDEAARMADRWIPGQAIVVNTELKALTCTVTARTLFRHNLPEQTVDDIARSFDIFMKGVYWQTVAPDVLGALPIRGYRRFQQARVDLRGVFTDLVTRYMTDPTDRGDLLSMLVAARDDGQGMTAEQLCDEVLTLTVGGTETASTALSWLFHALGQHPELDEQLAAEIGSVLGDRPVTFDDLPALGFTQRLVYEALRMYTPTWIFTRTANQDVDLGGTLIPRGAEVVYSLTALHRDPELYPDPGRFDPGRWAGPAREAPFLPFGSGRHKCIGDHFAMCEMVIVVATIAARWRLVPVQGQQVREVADMTVRPSRLLMLPHPRYRG